MLNCHLAFTTSEPTICDSAIGLVVVLGRARRVESDMMHLNIACDDSKLEFRIFVAILVRWISCRSFRDVEKVEARGGDNNKKRPREGEGNPFRKARRRAIGPPRWVSYTSRQGSPPARLDPRAT